jgi:pre-mRNA-splicing helicase BRR2
VFKRIIRKIKNKKDIELLDNEGYNIHDEQEIQLDFKEGGRITEENISKQTKNLLDLDAIKFEEGGHKMTNTNWSLPKGSYKVENKGYDEVYIPAVTHKPGSDEKLIPLDSLPEWTFSSFPSYTTHLNRIQSKVYDAAFKSSENLLICAPTGAGKTNIAMLTILNTMSLYQRKNGSFNTKAFKIIYVAPMKALVSEVVGNFSKRLIKYGIEVKELTGDMQLTKHQIEATQVIVTTPEKWDIVTRKAGDRAYVELVKLVIIDEIHLLHDSRGPVLESIVARTIRQIENTQEHVRIVGLSATLPNYTDVAAILRVKPNKGLFFFDNSFRPVPLEQIYVGITEKKAIKRVLLSNEICYEKVIERAGKHPILIFVHSRKETVRTAKMIRDMALSKDELHKLLRDDSATKEILKTEGDNSISNDVKDLLPFGIGIHHAGLPRHDRKTMEDLFAQKHIQLLVSTATLAWGVNLPAHTVIIKGTQIYNPEKGKWTELSPQDILQMMGRAGRPQYDKTGEGIIITSHQELQYYLSLNNMQLPIESQFITQLPDQLNAEIVMGSVSNIRDAVNWLAYTYLYVRMLRSPKVYGLTEDALENDPLLVQRRTDLIHTAAVLLDRAGLIKYDKRVGTFQSLPIGKVASHYYIKHESMGVYNKNLKPTMGMIDIFRLFSLSNEFVMIPVRENEKLELNKFIEKVPIPVKGSIDEPATKINILLQVFISKFRTEGYDLNADMVYVTQSAGRIMRALFEICQKKGWSQLTQLMLKCCKMVEVRMWPTMTPLRQFGVIREEILRKIERKEQFTWEHFYNMTPQEIGDVIKFQKIGKHIHSLVHQFPRLELKAFVQPITRTCIKIGLEIIVDFEWNPKFHKFAETFHVIVEDVDGDMILHHEIFVLKERDAQNDESHYLNFVVSLYEPLPPVYFVRVISDRWIRCEAVLPVSFRHFILPDKFPPQTEKKDIESLKIKECEWNIAVDFFSERFETFNTIQSQVFDSFYKSDKSVFLGAPTSSGKTA